MSGKKQHLITEVADYGSHASVRSIGSDPMLQESGVDPLLETEEERLKRQQEEAAVA